MNELNSSLLSTQHLVRFAESDLPKSEISQTDRSKPHQNGRKEGREGLGRPQEGHRFFSLSQTFSSLSNWRPTMPKASRFCKEFKR